MEKERLIFSDVRGMVELDKVPLRRKLCYAVGSLPYSMCATVIGFYLTVFLLEVALLDTQYVLIIVFLGRVWDGITDPMVGYLCGRTKTKLGQFRPWLLLSAVPTAIAYSLLWFTPHIGSQPFDFLYYIIMYFAVQAFLTCVHVPFTSLTVHLSYNQKEVDSVTLYRLIFELFGTLVGIGIYTLSYTVFVREGDDLCTDSTRSYDLNKERAYRYHAVAIGIISIICLLITFFTVREQKDEVVKKSEISFLAGLKQTFGFKAYRELMLMELFSWLAVQFVQGNFVFYVKYGVDLKDQYVYVVATLLFCTVLWMPFWQLILIKYGKKTAFRCGMFSLMPCLIALLFLNYYPLLIYLISMLGGAGVSAAYLIPASMVPDVVDAALLETGIRREELFYAFFVFGNKFSAGITLAISTGIYKIFGYDETQCDQPWTVGLMFKILVSGPPLIFIAISLFFLHRYPITDATRTETMKKLKSRRKDDCNQTAPPTISSSILEHDSNNRHYSACGTLKGDLQTSKM